MKTQVYSSLILLCASTLLVAANPVAAAPTCVLNVECVGTIPETQCFVTLTGAVDTGGGCNGGTLNTICAVRDIGCFSSDNDCLAYVGVRQSNMIGFVCY